MFFRFFFGKVRLGKQQTAIILTPGNKRIRKNPAKRTRVAMKHYKLMPHCKSDWPLSIAYYAPFPCHEPLHDHDCWEIMIALDGSGWCDVAGRRYPVEPGMVFLVSPGKTHEYQIPLGTLIFNIMFSADIFSGEGRSLLFEMAEKCAVRCPADELERFRGSLLRLDRELDEQRRGYECLSAAVLTELLVEMARGRWELTDSASSAPDELNAAIDYLRRHYRERITLAQLGTFLNRNPAYVGQFFKHHTYQTVNAYIQKLRVTEGQRLLETTDRSVARIADEIGFFDAAHFSRAFRRISGMTPNMWRRNAKSPPGQGDALPGAPQTNGKAKKK